MIACHDSAVLQVPQVKGADVRGTICHRKIQHLVKVAIIQRTVPANGQRITTHDASSRCRIKGVCEPFHVPLIIAGLQQEFEKPTDWHIGNGVEMVKLHAMLGVKLFSKLRFDRFLFGWQKRAYGIVDEIQQQPAIRLPVSEPVQQP